MNIQLGMDEVELLQLVTKLETLATLVMVLKEVAMRMRYHMMWLSMLKITPTKEVINTTTCVQP